MCRFFQRGLSTCQRTVYDCHIHRILVVDFLVAAVVFYYDHHKALPRNHHHNNNNLFAAVVFGRACASDDCQALPRVKHQDHLPQLLQGQLERPLQGCSSQGGLEEPEVPLNLVARCSSVHQYLYCLEMVFCTSSCRKAVPTQPVKKSLSQWLLYTSRHF